MATIYESLSSATRKEELMSVEEELRKIEIVALSLKRRKNALQPFFRISLEILQEIFLLLSRSEDFFSERFEDPWDWLVVTWVCHYWREAATGYPKLWTIIEDFCSLSRVEAYLERSMGMNLVVHLGVTQDVPGGVSSLLDNNMDRIKDLALGVDQFIEEWDSLQNVFSRDSLPCLKRLKLCDDNYNYVEASSIFQPAMRLEALCLKNVSLPWDHAILRALSELHLEDIDKLVQPSLPEILAVLDACPRLKILKLINAGPMYSFESENLETVIDLPYLRYIKVGTISFRMCEALLNSLDYSERIIWDITITDFPVHEYIEPISPEVLDLERLHRHVTLTIENDRLSFSSIGPRDKYPTKLTLVLSHNMIFSGEAFDSLCTVLGSLFWVTAKSITIVVAVTGFGSDTNFISREAWGHLFVDIVDHENLTFSFPSRKGLEENCLQAFLKISASSFDPTAINCQFLESLRIESATFRSELVDGEDAFRMLKENLRLRVEKNSRLKKLSFNRCSGISEEDINSLRKLDLCDEICWES